MDRRSLLRTAAAAPVGAALSACTQRPNSTPIESGTSAQSSGANALPQWGAPRTRASSDFWRTWGDGKAELIGYETISPRYGHLHPAELALIYVTEPFSRRSLIKDDDAQNAERMDVLKVNISEKFLTGVYPYSILTSVFCPVDALRAERFQPAKITLSVQEWCGHVFTGVWPDEQTMVHKGFSYFASEGDTDERIPITPATLFEDALLVQLRELDGPFNGGRDWEGALIPALWRQRRAHRPLRAEQARIVRSTAAEGENTRFVLTAGEYTREFTVERAASKRIVSWNTSDGMQARMIRATRLPYWGLHNPGDESHRAEFGLDGTPQRVIEAPPNTRIGF